MKSHVSKIFPLNLAQEEEIREMRKAIEVVRDLTDSIRDEQQKELVETVDAAGHIDMLFGDLTESFATRMKDLADEVAAEMGRITDLAYRQMHADMVATRSLRKTNSEQAHRITDLERQLAEARLALSERERAALVEETQTQAATLLTIGEHLTNELRALRGEPPLAMQPAEPETAPAAETTSDSDAPAAEAATTEATADADSMVRRHLRRELAKYIGIVSGRGTPSSR